MATRALIGTIETDAAGNQVLTSTYNHYDGYPENLGVGLNKFYDQTDAAVEISNRGYISYLNPETGEIEAKHNEPADKVLLPDNFEDAMREIYQTADSYGANYAYLYDFDNAEWVDSKMYGSKKLMDTFSGTGIENQFSAYPFDDLGVDGDNALELEENNYADKWNSFITENQAIDDQWVMYVKSLVNDIRLNGINDYSQFSENDFKEDFDNYIADKMGI